LLLTSCSSPEKPLVVAEKNVFVLDISGSNNAASLWTESLRPSIIGKLVQPFGYPSSLTENGQPQAPTDITLFSITGNSVDEPSLPVVTEEDATELWDSIFNLAGGTENKDRLEEYKKLFFGGDGLFSNQSEKLRSIPIGISDQESCISESVENIEKNADDYFRRLSADKHRKIAETVCNITTRIAQNLMNIDDYIQGKRCPGDGKPCSDIFGALIRINAAAKDLVSSGRKGFEGTSPALCVAIASDMLHNDGGMKQESALNSRQIALTAKTVEAAQEKGKLAAQQVGLKFPDSSELSIRLYVLGMGSGSNPIPRDRMAYLDAYWQGVWSEAGIEAGSTKSLDKACQGQGN
jgi:hypothetical protein